MIKMSKKKTKKVPVRQHPRRKPSGGKTIVSKHQRNIPLRSSAFRIGAEGPLPSESYTESWRAGAEHYRRLHAQNEVFFEAGYKAHKLFEAASKLIDEAHITINEDGLSIIAADPSKICLQQVEASGTVTAEIDTGLSIGVNLDHLKEMTKVRAGEKPTISLKIKENTPLSIKKDKKKPNVEVSKTQYALDIEMEDYEGMLTNLKENLAKEGIPGRVVLTWDQLDQILYESGSLSEVVDFNITPTGFDVRESGQIGTSKISISRDELETHCIGDDKDGTVSASYSLTFLKTLKNIKPLIEKDDFITFEYSDDSLLHISVPLREVDGHYRLYLAPRVPEAEFDDDDEDF